jgi:hypothetical protein
MKKVYLSKFIIQFKIVKTKHICVIDIKLSTSFFYTISIFIVFYKMIGLSLNSLIQFPIRPLKGLIAFPNLNDSITPDPAGLITLNQLTSCRRIDPHKVPGKVRNKEPFHNFLPF